MEQLIFFRALQGIGAGAVMPITMTIIGDLYSEAKRPSESTRLDECRLGCIRCYRTVSRWIFS